MRKALLILLWVAIVHGWMGFTGRGWMVQRSMKGAANDEAFLHGPCSKIEVCTMEKYCKRKGSEKTWELFQKYAEESGIEGLPLCLIFLLYHTHYTTLYHTIPHYTTL